MPAAQMNVRQPSASAVLTSSTVRSGVRWAELTWTRKDSPSSRSTSAAGRTCVQSLDDPISSTTSTRLTAASPEHRQGVGTDVGSVVHALEGDRSDALVGEVDRGGELTGASTHRQHSTTRGDQLAVLKLGPGVVDGQARQRLGGYRKSQLKRV